MKKIKELLKDEQANKPVRMLFLFASLIFAIMAVVVVIEIIILTVNNMEMVNNNPWKWTLANVLVFLVGILYFKISVWFLKFYEKLKNYVQIPND